MSRRTCVVVKQIQSNPIHYTRVDMSLITMHTVRPISKSSDVNTQGVVAAFHKYNRSNGKCVTNPIRLSFLC